MERNPSLFPFLSGKGGNLLRILGVCLALWLCPVLRAQTSIHTAFHMEPVQKLPEYPGGEQGLSEFFQKELVYPSDARAYGLEGVVTVHVVIDVSGKVKVSKTKVEQLRFRKRHTELDGYTGATQRQESERWQAQIKKEVGAQMEHEVLRVLHKAKKWKPGREDGKKTDVEATLKVYFQYNEETQK